ncbi:MAG TPA: metal ABC transporter permease [Negativicutes bacterium]|nr:metal ABC transporter permease [Negativicutes bacterium]
MLELFQYTFMQHAILAGFMVACICPVIGIFLVVRRLALIGDGLGHISFAGVAAGWLWGVYPVYTAALFAVCGGIGIEMLRQKQRHYADMVLAVVFYTGIALAIVFTSMVRSSGTNLLSYLFGSIVTVTARDVTLIYGLGGGILLIIGLLYKELLYVSCDEDAARVNGLRVSCHNLLLVILTAVTVSVAMRVVGILLVSALMIVPVAAGLQMGRSFAGTMGWAVFFAEVSVVAGLYASFYLDFAPGGAIVLTAVLLFLLAFLSRMVCAVLRPRVRKEAGLRV